MNPLAGIDGAKAHLGATVNQVIISAPATNEDLSMVLGVNEDRYDAGEHHVSSNACGTTNCLAPVVKVLAHCGIVSGIMTTIHSYPTTSQSHRTRILPARAAALNMIPSSHRRSQGPQAGHPRSRRAV